LEKNNQDKVEGRNEIKADLEMNEIAQRGGRRAQSPTDLQNGCIIEKTKPRHVGENQEGPI